MEVLFSQYNHSVSTLKFLNFSSGVCVLALICYRLYVIIDCMKRSPEEFPSVVDRVIWVGLAGFVPLGIGAYLYHVVLLRKPLQWFFLIPIGVLFLNFLYVMEKVWSFSQFPWSDLLKI